MTIVQSSRESIWRATFANVTRIAPTMWRWLVGFSLAQCAVMFALSQLNGNRSPLFGLQHVLQTISSHDPSTLAQLKEQSALANPHPLLALPFGLANVAVLALAYYVITVLCLQRLGKSAPSLSPGHFWMWFRAQIKAGLYLLGWSLVYILGLGVVSAVVIIVMHRLADLGQLEFQLLATLPFAIGFILMLRLVLTLTLVSPLGALNKKPVIGNSRRLTKGNCLRILGGLVMIWAVSFVLTAIADTVVYLVQQTGNLVAANLTYALLSGLTVSIQILLNALFSCTAFKIRLREHPGAISNLSPAL